MGGFAWVTLATNDSYSLGALVLAHSLKKANTAHKLVVLITPSVSQPMREQLQTVFDVVKLVEVLDSKDEAHLALLKRPELGITFTKIHCWRLTEFDKCVFLDADTLVVRNCDELFEREELSAAPDFSWPDCFNSGVFVFKPSVETFDKILQFAVERGSFDGGDQGLLNMFFSDWATKDIKKHLPFTYNLSSLAAYNYIPAFKQYGAETRIVHFIGTGKPWLQKLDPSTKTISPTPGAEHLTPMLQSWWDLFCERVHPHLNKNLDNCNGMPQHAPVEACSNSVINEINDETQKPCNPEPYAPYREKDDYRQFNLPYQPFDVKGSSGELLNIEFLNTLPPPPPPAVEEEKKENVIEQAHNGDKVDEQIHDTEEKEEREGIEMKEMEQQEEKKEEEKQSVQETVVPKGPFDYDTFFPDEKCVANYLERNVIAYQPFGENHHDHQENFHSQPGNNNYEQSYKPEQNHDQQNQEQLYEQRSRSPQQNNLVCDDKQHENQNTFNEKENFQHNVELLPRFLTIPEDDMRQSGNKSSERHNEHSFSQHTNLVKEPKFPLQDFKETAVPPPLPPPSHLEDKPPEKLELKKSRSMPQLDVTKIGTTLRPSVWQSQPNVNTDPKKYSMPKLKPILPRSNSFHKTVPTSFSRITLYTEFLMSSDYREPLDLPKDKIGFVEMQIVKEAHLKRSKSEGSLKNKFGPLPYIEEDKKLTLPKKRPFSALDYHSELIDIRECKRQLGNKPKPKNEEKKENIRHVVPKPKKLKKLGPFKRIKSKESMMPEKVKGNPNKKDIKTNTENKIQKPEINGETNCSRKKSREKTEVLKPTVNGNSNNVEDILEKLKNFSKDYIHYFGDMSSIFKPIKANEKNCANRKEKNNYNSDKLEIENRVDNLNFSNNYLNLNSNFNPEEKSTGSGKLLNIKTSSTPIGKEGTADLQIFNKATEPKKINDLKNKTQNNSTNEDDKLKDSNNKTSKLMSVDGEVEEKIGENISNDVKEVGPKEKVEGLNTMEKSVISGKTNEEMQKSLDNDKLEITDGNEVEKEIKKNVSSEVNGVDTNAKLGDSNTIEELVISSKTNKKEERNVESKKLEMVGNEIEKKISKNILNDVEEVVANEHLSESNLSRKLLIKNKENEVEEKGMENDKLENLNTSLNLDKVRSIEKEKSPDEVNNLKSVEKISEEPEDVNKENLVKPTQVKKLENLNSSLNLDRVRTTEKEKSPDEINNLKSVEKKSEELGDVNAENLEKPTEVENQNSKEINYEHHNGTTKYSNASKKIQRDVNLSPLQEAENHNEKSKQNLDDFNRVDGLSKLEKVEDSKNPDAFENEVALSKAEKSGEVKQSKKFDVPAEIMNYNESDIERCKGVLPESELMGSENKEELLESRLVSGIAGAIAQLNLESTEQSPALQEYIRRQNWESGNMDYMGKDSFDNIWAKICQTVEGKDTEVLAGSLGPPGVPGTEPQKPGEVVAQSTTPKVEATKSSDLEYIETLPSEPPVRSTEEDEIIFSKPEKGAPLLSNIKEEEEGKTGAPLATINASGVPATAPVGLVTVPQAPTAGTMPSPAPQAPSAGATLSSAPQAASPGTTPSASQAPSAGATPSSAPQAPSAGTMPSPAPQAPSAGTTPSSAPQAPSAGTTPSSAPQAPAGTTPSSAPQAPAGTTPLSAPQALSAEATPSPAPQAPTAGTMPSPAPQAPAGTTPSSAPQAPAGTTPSSAPQAPTGTMPSSAPQAPSAGATPSPAPQAPAGTTPSPTPQAPAGTMPSSASQAPSVGATPLSAPQAPAGTMPSSTPQAPSAGATPSSAPQAPSAGTTPSSAPQAPSPAPQASAGPTPSPTPQAPSAGTTPSPAPQASAGPTPSPTPQAPSAGTTPSSAPQAPSAETSVPLNLQTSDSKETSVSNSGTPTTPDSGVPKATSEEAKILAPIKTQIISTTEALKEEATVKQGEPTPTKDETGATASAAPQERQVPGTPTVTPPTPTTPTSMALMVIPKDSKNLVKLSDIIDPKKPAEGQQIGPPPGAIPMPPVPEHEPSEQKKTKSPSPTESTDQPQKTSRSDSLKENGKQKKGVFSKILEIVGVSPKDKKEDGGESANSVFYDVENATEAIQSAEKAEEVKEILREESGKEASTESAPIVPPLDKPSSEQPPEKQTQATKKGEPEKSKGKQKPARNQKSDKAGDTKSKSVPSKDSEPKKPETPLITDSPQSKPATLDSEPQVTSESPVEPVTKEKVKSEIEDILGKAKCEAESRLTAVDTEMAGKAEELVNTMKLIVDDGKEVPKAEQAEVEELKVTSPEERQKHKGEVTASKLSDQILKAIPPPRRKAISDAKAESSSSTGAIPKTTTPEPAPAEEQKAKEKPADSGKSGKSSKPSSIPVPPPRNKPKPPPSKGKSKK